MKLVLLTLVLILPQLALAQPVAFPGAEGFGKYATGGRGGKVYRVTNLNDDGPGSLREAITKNEPRTILFAVSGNIKLKSPLTIHYGNVTIAGQSAPGDGICIQDYPVGIDADNVIVRFLRFRLGDETQLEADAFGSNRGNSNILIDHCSISWATDECASFYRNKNFTMQWCIISESLNESVHTKGSHGYGGIWGGEGASFHHNLLAHHTNRLPRFSGSSTTPNSPNELVDFRNNVIYNWTGNGTYGGERGRYNIVNNYYKKGPANRPKANWFINPSSPLGKFFIEGNCLEDFPEISKNNWTEGVRANHLDSAKAEQPFKVVAIPNQTARHAYDQVLKWAGASLKRDAVDLRVVQEVRTGSASFGKTSNGIIDSQKDVGGWPLLNSKPALPDADGDGLPDAWEKKHKLNPNLAADALAYSLHRDYTNLEVYLNELVQHINK
ncbi:MAG: pectate lyase [Cyclobacteriaceae bacterium]|nr:pectate lyase [Cyclobacteriaceae bacterium]